MSIDYNDIRKFVKEKHPEKKSTFITILEMKLKAAGIDDLNYFKGMHPKGIKWILDNSKDSYLFIEYLKFKTEKDLDSQTDLKRIDEIGKNGKSAMQLKSWVKKGMKLSDFNNWTREQIKQKCALKYKGPTTIDGIIFILNQLGITIKAESSQESKPDPEPER